MKHGQKWMLTVNSTIIISVLVLNCFYQSNGFVFALKCICSAGFALLGGFMRCCSKPITDALISQ